MLTRHMRAEICLVIYTVMISCLAIGVVGVMRSAVHFAQRTETGSVVDRYVQSGMVKAQVVSVAHRTAAPILAALQSKTASFRTDK